MTTARPGSGRRSIALGVLFFASVVAGEARAQQMATDSAPLGAQAATGPAVVYLHEGGSIRGQLLADNGPNGIRIRSQKSGATFMVPAAEIDSVVRGPWSVAAGGKPAALPVSARAPSAVPAQSSSPGALVTGAAVALTLKAVTPAPVATQAPKPAAPTPPPPRAATPAVVAAVPVVSPVAKPTPSAPAPTPIALAAPAIASTPAVAAAAPVVSPVAKPTPSAPAPTPIALTAPAIASAPVAVAPPPVVASAPAPKPASPTPAPAAPSTISVTAPPTTVMEGLIPPPAAAPNPGAAPDTAAVLTTISFISGTDIYIGAGRQDGLVEGAVLSVVRGDTVVATLIVKFLSSHKSDCELVQGTADLALGDQVRFHRRTAAQQLALATPTVPRPRRLSGQGVHGRIGSRYLRATTTTVAAGQQAGSNGFNQPSLDARLYGLAIGGTPLGVALDLRARQTTTTSAGVHTVDGHTRAYQAVAFWNAPDAKFRVAAGRQYLSAVSAIGLFDGGLVELNGSHLTFGGFAGWEPDPATLAFSGAVHDYGAYLTAHNRPGSMTATAFTVGAVGSYQGNVERREWGLLQANVSNRYLSLYLLQEIDYYRPWKLQGPDAEPNAWSGTSQFANVSVRPKPWLSVNATYDKRRSVRLIRDFTNPETNFDDAYREGFGAGVQYAGRMFYMGGDWRRSTGATVLGANSYTASVGANRVAPLSLGFSLRATWYQNDNDSTGLNPGAAQTNGRLYSGHLSVDPVTLIHVDLNAGVREEDNPNITALQRSTWYGMDLDVALARQWYFSFSGLRQKDPGNPGTSTLTQIYGGLTWRF